MDIKIKIENESLQRTLDAYKEKVGNLEPVLDVIGQAILSRVHESFERESSPDGASWKPLAFGSVLRRKKKGTWPGKILHDSGELRGSLQSRVLGNRVEIGPDAPHGVFHQLGATLKGGGKIPARPFLTEAGGGIPDPWIRQCLDIIQQAIDEAEKG